MAPILKTQKQDWRHDQELIEKLASYIENNQISEFSKQDVLEKMCNEVLNISRRYLTKHVNKLKMVLLNVNNTIRRAGINFIGPGLIGTALRLNTQYEEEQARLTFIRKTENVYVNVVPTRMTAFCQCWKKCKPDCLTR